MATERDYKTEEEVKTMVCCVDRGLLCRGSECMGWRSVVTSTQSEPNGPWTEIVLGYCGRAG